MGRELKRVPMDFDWPNGIVWKGYINPYRATECKACGGTGYNTQTRVLADAFYDHDHNGQNRWCDKLVQEEVDALVEAGRLRKFRSEDRTWETVPRTAEEVNAANAPGGRSFGEMYHDGVNRWILIETRAKRLGVYGQCKVCGGNGYYYCSDDYMQKAEEWECIKPPAGDGYQLWETTSEGSPVSPVFATIEELCEWAAGNATTFGSHRATAEQWRQMLDDGYVFHQEGSMVFM